MHVSVIDTTEHDFGKHCYSQIKEFDHEVAVRDEKLLDVPGIMSRSDYEAFIVIINKDNDFVDQTLGKIIDVEVQTDSIVKKLVLDSSDESQEAFVRRGRRAAGEIAEKLCKNIS